MSSERKLKFRHLDFSKSLNFVKVEYPKGRHAGPKNVVFYAKFQEGFGQVF